MMKLVELFVKLIAKVIGFIIGHTIGLLIKGIIYLFRMASGKGKQAPVTQEQDENPAQP
jgi:hypothetical protein